jgi:hypothetical protein
VIEEMRGKTAAACPNMQWHVMDVTALTFADGAYDVVVDKGMLDAIFHTPENEPQVRMVMMMMMMRRRRRRRMMMIIKGTGPMTWSWTRACSMPSSTRPRMSHRWG